MTLRARARAALIAAMLVAAGCTAVDRELLPSEDPGRRDGGGETAMCLGGAEDCAACAPACEGCARCGVACAPAGACTVGLREPVTGTLECDHGAACGRAASAFDYCRADQAPCVVTGSAPSRIACLHGRCDMFCDAACDVECASGDCTLTCRASPCAFTACAGEVRDCGSGVFACGAACPGS